MDNSLAQELADRDFADVSADPSGARAVVLGSLDALDEVAVRAPAAVVVVTGEPLAEKCAQVLARTLFPRARVIGSDAPAAVVEAIVLDRGAELDCVAKRGDGFEPTRARIGRGGVREFV